MRFRSFVLPLAMLAAFFALVPIALADAPPSQPVALRHVDFDNLADPADTLGVDQASMSATYAGPMWGRITNRHASGSYGFWCAGSSPQFFSNGGYPAGTHGIAYLQVPDTTGWVRSQVQFSYCEPSVRSGESPFVVSWSSVGPTASHVPGEYQFGYFKPNGLSSFRTVALNRGDSSLDGGTIGLGAGWLRFQFLSQQDSGGTAEGVTLDDIIVSGYEFNAPRNLRVLRDHADHKLVTLSWDKPFGRDDSTVDARDLYYRVWRYDNAAKTWAEVTLSDARVHSTTCTDTASTTGSYQYVVQAWEQTSTTSWGILPSPVQLGPAVIRFPTTTASPALVNYNGASTVVGTLVDETGAPLSGVSAGIVVKRKYAGGSWTTVPATVSETAAGTYSVTVASAMNATYYLSYAPGSAIGPSVAVAARASLSTPSTPSSIKHGASFKVTGKASRGATARTITLRAYRKQGSTYVLRASTSVKISGGTGTASYKKAWSLKLKGTYHLVAYVSDSSSAATTSSYRTLVVK